MKKSLVLAALLTFPLLASQTDPLSVTWQKAFGGSKDDVAKGVAATEDGGLIIASTTRSFGHGKTDMNVMKLDEKGNKLWQKNFGGERKETASAITQTADGGYIAVGSTKSYGAGGYDFYIVKMDANGEKIWEKVAGGAAKDDATAVTATKDGGVLVLGTTKSYGTGSYNYYAVKLDAKGELEWEQVAGGKDWDIPSGVAEADDGSFLLVGKSESFGENSYDGYVVKLSSQGKFIWEKTFGGKKEDMISGIAKGKDGGFLMVGKTKSYKDKKGDAFIIKLDKDGKKVFVKTYGDKGKDRAFAVTATADGGYAITGSSRTMSYGRTDFILIMMNKDGEITGSNHYGAKKEEIAYGITELKDGGLVMVGDTKTHGSGGMDIYVVRVK